MCRIAASVGHVNCRSVAFSKPRLQRRAPGDLGGRRRRADICGIGRLGLGGHLRDGGREFWAQLLCLIVTHRADLRGVRVDLGAVDRDRTDHGGTVQRTYADMWKVLEKLMDLGPKPLGTQRPETRRGPTPADRATCFWELSGWCR